MLKNEIKSELFRIRYRDKHVRIASGCNIFSTAVLEGYNSFGKNTLVGGNVGRGTYCADNCELYCDIGRFCSIGNDVKVLLGDHPSHTWVSTHPAFFSHRKQAGFTFTDHEKYNELKKAADSHNFAVIGNDVWIGSNVSILQGVTIGDGAIIAAGEPARRRVGLKVTGKGIIREHQEVMIGDRLVGMTTSGTHCPYLGYPVAMAMLDTDIPAEGAQVEAVVRGRRVAAETVKLPFYHR